MTTERDLSASVRAEVARAGETWASTARMIGMPYSNWRRRIRTGKWSVEELRRIANALGVPLSTLTGEDR